MHIPLSHARVCICMLVCMPAADVLLPLFFAASGLKTNIATINTWRGWGVVLALICIATFAKVWAREPNLRRWGLKA